MAKKSISVSTPLTETTSTSATNSQDPSTTLLLPQTEVIKINSSDLSSLKTTLDDLVREFFSLSQHNFTPSTLHLDIRLLLGWSSVLIALGTTYYAYKLDNFKESKFLTGCGVAAYTVLNAVLAWWIQFVEKSIVWKGKRRTIASRITTELLEISSSIESTPSSSSGSNSLFPYPISLFFPSRTSPSPKRNGEYPKYTLKLNYTQSANANKSLLNRQELELSKPVGELFDREGRVGRGEVERWLAEGLREITAGGGNGKEQ